MNTILDDLAEKNPNWTPRRVWTKLKKIDKKSSTWIGMTEMQVMSRVKHIRCQALDKYVFRMIEQPHARKMKDSKCWFLQFNMSVINQDANELYRFFCFGNPELFPLLRRNSEIHVDETFFCTPTPYE